MSILDKIKARLYNYKTDHHKAGFLWVMEEVYYNKMTLTTVERCIEVGEHFDPGLFEKGAQEALRIIELSRKMEKIELAVAKLDNMRNEYRKEISWNLKNNMINCSFEEIINPSFTGNYDHE